MLMRKVMAEQPAEDAVLRAEAAVLLKEVVVAEEVLLMMQETLEMLVEREDVEAVANLVVNLVAAESLALRRIQAIGVSSSRTTTT